MKILIVSHTLPVPANSGGPIRVLNLARNLSRTDEVDLISAVRGAVPSADSDELGRCFSKVHLVPWRRPGKVKDLQVVMRMLAKGIPYYTKYVYSEELAQTLRRITGETKYDVIVIEHTDEARYLEALHPQHGAATFLSMHNVTTVQYRRMCALAGNPVEKFRLLLTWLAMRSWEPRMAARFDGVITVSEKDREALLRMQPGINVVVVPNGVDTRALTPLPREGRQKNILLVGSLGYAPNVDAAFLLHDRVFPLVRAEVPDCTLTIVGRDAPPGLKRLDARPAVCIEGSVPEVRPYHAQALVSVVPLRAGGGTRIKILEAMALGTPVVSTRVGCEGIDIVHGEHLLIADSAEEMASAVVSILRDGDLWHRLSRNGRAFVEQRHDWASVAGDLRSVFERAKIGALRIGPAAASKGGLAVAP
jgi:polysaccharide biosynthesis protein PslH